MKAQDAEHADLRKAARRRAPAFVLLAGVVLAIGVALALRGTAGQAPFLAGMPPPNDGFANAQSAATLALRGTTGDATMDQAEQDAGVGAADQRAVWFLWTAETTGWMYVTPTRVGGTDPQPEVKVFTGTSINALTRADVAPSGGAGLPTDAAGDAAGVSLPATAGTSYMIAVVGSGDGAPFDLTLSQPALPTPVNDHAIDATDIGFAAAASSSAGSQSTEVDTATLATATSDPGEPAHGGAAAAHSLWYSFTAPPEGGTVTFTAVPVFGSPGPVRAAVYTGTYTVDPSTNLDVVEPVAVPGGANGGPVTLSPGTRYLVAVDGPEAWFDLRVAAAGVTAGDTTPPVVHCDPAPTTWATGDAISVACTATDTGSGLALPADAAFTLTAAVPVSIESDQLATGTRPVCDQAGNCADAGPVTGLRADRRAPAITCGPVPATWTAQAPTVACGATDGGSGLADAADASKAFTATVPPGTEQSVIIPGGDICDAVGNCAPAGPFDPALVDQRAPTITCAAPPAGPSHDEIAVECTAVDEGSGLADPTARTFTLTTTVGAGGVDPVASTDTRSVCDLAGNCATGGPITGLSVDRAVPSVTCTPADGQTVDAWRSGPLTIDCAISDRGTGLAPGTAATQTLTATIADGQASAAVASSTGTPACDLAGNCVPVGPVTGLRIDRAAPTVTCPPAGDGWTKGPAKVSCVVVDEGSGVAGTTPVELTAEGTDREEALFATGSQPVCDNVGHCVAAGPVAGLKIDRKAPAVTCDAPPAGTSRIEVRIHCRAADGGSGLAAVELVEFDLVTSLGAGNKGSATTDTRAVCDVAGNCETAGPFTVSLDLTDTGPGTGPPLPVPARVTVLSTYSPIGPTPIPYRLPVSPGASVTCRPPPSTTAGLGWTTVVCEALAPSGSTLASFPLVVKALPELAGSGTGTPGGGWRAVGVGYAPGTDVSVEIDGKPLQVVASGGDGRVAVAFVIPVDLPDGAHVLVLRGVDGGGQPLIVVNRLDAVSALPEATPDPVPPGNAPELPPSGPELPPDPGDPPVSPLAPPTTPPTSPPTTPPTTPESPTTTSPGPTSTPPTTSGEDANGPTGDADGGPGTDGSDDGSRDGTDHRTTTGDLPISGAAITRSLVLALSLIGAGLGLWVVSRRRRSD